MPHPESHLYRPDASYMTALTALDRSLSTREPTVAKTIKAAATSKPAAGDLINQLEKKLQANSIKVKLIKRTISTASVESTGIRFEEIRWTLPVCTASQYPAAQVSHNKATASRATSSLLVNTVVTLTGSERCHCNVPTSSSCPTCSAEMP